MFKLIFLGIASSSLLFAEFTLSNSGVITDSASGIQWQADASNNSENIAHLSWQDAIDNCERLALDGGGWRLPNKNELLSIVDYGKSEPATHEIFKNTTMSKSSYWSSYWTSTTSMFNNYPTFAKQVNFYSGNLDHANKPNKAYVRCVRDTQ